MRVEVVSGCVLRIGWLGAADDGGIWRLVAG